MCEIPDDYMLVDDVVTHLEVLKDDLNCAVDGIIRSLTHDYEGQLESLRQTMTEGELDKAAEKFCKRLLEKQSNNSSTSDSD